MGKIVKVAPATAVAKYVLSSSWHHSNDIIQFILTFLSHRDLIHGIFINKTFYKEIFSLSKKIVKVLERKYFPISFFNYPYKQLNSLQQLNKLCTHMEMQTNSVIIVRGFVAYQGLQLLNSDISDDKIWRRCMDTKVCIIVSYITSSKDAIACICTSQRDRGHFAAIWFMNEIYAIGTISKIATGTCEKYNPIFNTWTNIESLPKKLSSVGAAVLHNSLCVVGGEVDGEISGDVYRYHDGTWQLEDAWRLNRPRSKHACVGFMDKIWIAGGHFEGDSSEKFDNSVEFFDPQTLKWEEGPRMIARRDYANLLVCNEKLFAVGGDVDVENKQAIRTIERLNMEEQKWELVTSFIDERRGFSTCAIDNKIYIFGGCSEQEADLNEKDTWDSYDVVHGKWESKVTGHFRKMPIIENWGQAVHIPKINIDWNELDVKHVDV